MEAHVRKGRTRRKFGTLANIATGITDVMTCSYGTSASGRVGFLRIQIRVASAKKRRTKACATLRARTIERRIAWR